jgi:membrane-associated phospholipid phosphatase
LQAADDWGVERLNGAVRTAGVARNLTIGAATGLAWVEVLLMAGLALGGRTSSVVRMLAAVALVYLASEALGGRWPRRRPFAELAQVEALVAHTAERSFPSRHVASGLAMAVIGGRAHPRLGRAMTAVAWGLGLSRVAAGLHYPSDVLAGALIGIVLGRLLRRP